MLITPVLDHSLNVKCCVSDNGRVVV